jgi:hypothetical protein
VNPLADEIRSKVTDRVMVVFVEVDGRQGSFFVGKYGPEWLRNATDADIRRVLIY